MSINLLKEILELEASGRMLSNTNVSELQKCIQILTELINKNESAMNETGNNMATVSIENGVVKVKDPVPIN